MSGTYTLTVTSADGCTSTVSTDVTVNTLPVPAVLSNSPICVGDTILLESLPDHMVNYSWSGPDNFLSTLQNPIVSMDATNAMSGTYIINLTDSLGCSNSESTIILVDAPVIQNITTTPADFSSSNGALSIDAFGGSGILQYSINEDQFQNDHNFSNLTSGTYTVEVRDQEGCITSSIAIIEEKGFEIPNFFTPNNDGQHDKWFIKWIKFFPNANIFIYDRFGKLLVKLKGSDEAWDGIYNGNPVISDDYWYVLDFNDGTKPISGHFSLVR